MVACIDQGFNSESPKMAQISVYILCIDTNYKQKKKIELTFPPPPQKK